VSSAAATASFAEATGLPPVTAANYARALREFSRAHGVDFWVQSPQGGAHKTATPQPRHLANYIISLAAGQPIEAPAAVGALGGLIRLSDPRFPEDMAPEGSIWAPPSSPQPPSEVQASLTLHGLLELLITGWGAASADERRAVEARATAERWTLTLSHDRLVAAWVSWNPEGARLITWAYGSPDPIPAQPELFDAHVGAFDLPQRRARIERLTRIPFSLIIVAAEQWANSLVQRGGLKLSGPGNTDTPELKTPVPLAGGPASKPNQTPHTELPGTDTLEAKPRRKRNQSLRGLEAAGRSINPERPSNDTRPHSTDAAAA
jgi:hypothetical protein